MQATTSLSAPAKYRIASIDLLKGLVMVIMALDHVRDYFHASAYSFDPADPNQTTLFLFFTRWITHFCAPAFSFLAGVSACIAGRKKTKAQLASFLITRGLWLIVMELTIIGFGWYFDVTFGNLGLLVIWSLGISMIVLSALIYLPRTAILLFSCLLIFGHNLLDNVHAEGSILWAILHEQQPFQLTAHTQLLVGYPIIPWIAVMALGYYTGSFYEASVAPEKRKKLFNYTGSAALVLFIILRWTNVYGDARPFEHFGSISKDIVSFLNPSKYPPSLHYLLMTLGVTFLFLANSEKLRGKVVDFFSTFGRVPFFYYILHIYLIHILASLFAKMQGFGWNKMVFKTWITMDPNVKGYGFDLWVVYLIWIVIIAALYPLCRRFDQYKQAHKEKKWLSYL
ncbi:DUF1624 domain-containing protein [Deminuibacter soli]|uniref:DUF1624 domain-containing protein n=1 Tax=Deminuibacter soli TaxID=2291815 RepID=A0A3E1NK44_9BACT|nr:heparan-alpha-glucosaminide N-acetyltransferase domain-containing protein [Deminuibacter soli]RFM28309.1 DUF1624 domain-containing protein [Deminuibacter soli]